MKMLILMLFDDIQFLFSGMECEIFKFFCFIFLVDFEILVNFQIYEIIMFGDVFIVEVIMRCQRIVMYKGRDIILVFFKDILLKKNL